MSDEMWIQRCCERTCSPTVVYGFHILSRRFCQALRLASLAHQEQYRLDGTPALWHPIEVCFQLQKHNVTDVDLLCGGLLHDALEDNPERQTELQSLIRRELGQPIAGWVDMLTDNPNLPNSAARKAEQLTMLAVAPSEVRTIKLADRLANLLSGPAPTWSEDKCAAYASHSWLLLEATRSSHAGLQQSMREVLQGKQWGQYLRPEDYVSPSDDTRRANLSTARSST